MAKPFEYKIFLEVTLMNFSTVLKNALFSLIHQMALKPDSYSKNPGIDFTRNRKLGMENLIRFLLCMERRSLPKELLDFFPLNTSCPSPSALCQQRAKLAPDTLSGLLHRFLRAFPSRSLFQGFRLLACDGSDLNIPRNPLDPSTFFQVHPGDRGYNQIHMNTLFDLGSGCYTDFILSPGHKADEKRSLVTMAVRSPFPGKTIFIADRGYENFNVFANIIELKQSFLIRIKDIHSNSIASALPAQPEEEFDIRVQWVLTRNQTMEIKSQPDLYRVIASHSDFDFLDREKQLIYPITLRFVRFRIKGGTYECIVTNLDPQEFPADKIRELYHLRWDIESSYRRLKYDIDLTYLHSRKMEYIIQEINLRILLYDFCSMIAFHVAVPQKNTQYAYQLNYSSGIYLCIRFLKLPEDWAPPELETLMAKHLLPVRKERHYDRHVKPQRFPGFLYR